MLPLIIGATLFTTYNTLTSLGLVFEMMTKKKKEDLHYYLVPEMNNQKKKVLTTQILYFLQIFS